MLLIKPLSKTLPFKVVTSALLITFSFQQILFAQDLVSTSLDTSLNKLKVEQTQAYAPSYLQAQEALHEDLIAEKQAIEDFRPSDLASQSSASQPQEAITPNLQNRSSSEQPQSRQTADTNTLTLSPEEQRSAENTAGSLTDDGTLIDYLNEARDLAQRGEALARNIAIAQEGLKIASSGLEDAKTKVSAKEAEIAAITDKLNTLNAEHERISQALEDLAEKSISDSNAVNEAAEYLNRVTGEKTALEAALDELKRDLDSKKERASQALQALQFAQEDYNNTISLIHQNLGDSFDINTSTYSRTYDAEGHVMSVTLDDERSELNTLTENAKDEVAQALVQALQELETSVNNAKNQVYEDETTSLAQLDGLCEQRRADIISQRDQGIVDVEAQRVSITNDANDQFGKLYNNYSTQYSYWSSQKAALYGSGNIGAYITAAAMADACYNQVISIASQWADQITSINTQCDSAITQLRNDAAAAIANIPAEKEAAIIRIGEERDSLLQEIDDEKIEQEAALYIERDKALAAIDKQVADAASAISAKESLILSAWQESYLVDELTIVKAERDNDAAAAQDVYDDNLGSFNSFIDGTFTPAENSLNAAQGEYEKTLADITSNENALSQNNAAIAPLNAEFTALSTELADLNNDLTSKSVYYNQIQGLLNDMLDAQYLLLIKKAQVESYYWLLLEQKEALKDSASRNAYEDPVPVSLRGAIAVAEVSTSATAPSDEAIYQPSTIPDVSESSPSASLPDTTDMPGLITILPVIIPPPPEAVTDVEAGGRVSTQIEYIPNELPLRTGEMPLIDSNITLTTPPSDTSLKESFKAIFSRAPSEGALEIFNHMMLLPVVADSINLSDYRITKDDTTYSIVDNRIASASVDNKEYIFNDDGNIEQVLDQYNNQILKYLYNDRGELEGVDFSDAKRALSDTKASIAGSVAVKFTEYEQAIDEEKQALQDDLEAKFSTYLGSIDDKARTLIDGVNKEYEDRLKVLDAEKSRLEALMSYLEKKDASFSGLDIDARVYSSENTQKDIDNIRSHVADINNAIDDLTRSKDEALAIVNTEKEKAVSNLANEKSKALQDLDTKIDGVKNTLIDPENAILAELEGNVADALSVISAQEDYALIRYYFKEALGREPTYDEMVYCQENGYTTKESLLGQALKDELAEREAFKAQVIENVKLALLSLRGGAEGDDLSRAQSRDEAIYQIINYLNNQSLHFGQSAVLPLLNELKANGVDITAEVLLTELILQEISDGNLNYEDNKPLLISMNALKEVAKNHGIELSGYNVTLEEVPQSAIALINDTHYVTITSIDQDTVTYIDPSKGKAGTSVTIPKEDFKKKFSGNILTQANNIDRSKLLSKEKLIEAKGAGFWGWISGIFEGIGDFFSDLFSNIGNMIADLASAVWDGIQAAVNVVVSAVQNIVMVPFNFINNIVEGNWADALWSLCPIVPGLGIVKSAVQGDWLGAGIQVGTLLLSAGLPGISAAASGIGQTIGQFASAIIAPISNIVSPLVNGISSVLGGITSSISNLVAPFFSSPIGEFVASAFIQPTVTAAVLEGSRVTLQGLGLNESISNIGSQAIASLASSNLRGNGDYAIPIALGTIVSASFQELGATLDLNNTVTTALSQIAGNFVTSSIISYDLNNPPKNEGSSETDPSAAEGSATETSRTEGAVSFLTKEQYESLTDFTKADFSRMWQEQTPSTTRTIENQPLYAINSAVNATIEGSNLMDAIESSDLSPVYTITGLPGADEMILNSINNFISPQDSAFFNYDPETGKAWLNSLETSGIAFWNIMSEDISYAADYWSAVESESAKEAREYLCLMPPKTYISSIDPLTKTVRVDQDLNYANIEKEPLLGILDLVSIGQLGNIRWDLAASDAGAKSANLQADITNGNIKGISFSGINTDGVELDKLTKLLAPDAPSSFAVTNSAGISSFIESNLRPEMAIITSPQERRVDVENWIDRMGYTKDKVLIVDVAGDLPYRPSSLLDLSLRTIANPANAISPVNLVATNFWNLVNDSPSHDYSPNSTKYTSVRILSGPGVGLDPITSHGVGVMGGINDNDVYTAEYNGRIIRGVTLKYIYGKFLKGEQP